MVIDKVIEVTRLSLTFLSLPSLLKVYSYNVFYFKSTSGKEEWH